MHYGELWLSAARLKYVARPRANSSDRNVSLLVNWPSDPSNKRITGAVATTPS